MDKTAIFIDGGYLSKALATSFDRATIDFSKLSEEIADHMPILRTYYYNCMPYKSASPTVSENDRFQKMQRFINSLERLDRYEVRLGKLEYRGRRENGDPIFQQKRVDILLGCDLVLLSAKQKIAKAVLLTGDSDFIPAIEVAKNEGVEISLYYCKDNLPHDSLMLIADERNELTADLIDRIRL